MVLACALALVVGVVAASVLRVLLFAALAVAALVVGGSIATATMSSAVVAVWTTFMCFVALQVGYGLGHGLLALLGRDGGLFRPATQGAPRRQHDEKPDRS